jgi:hypothetical protein
MYASLRPGDIFFDSFEEFRNGPIITGVMDDWLVRKMNDCLTLL